MATKGLAIIIVAAVRAVTIFAAEPRFPTSDYKKYPLVEFTENGKAKAVPYIEPDFVKEARTLCQKLLNGPFPLPEASTDVVQYHAGTTGWYFPTGNGELGPDAAQQRPIAKFVYGPGGLVKNVYSLNKKDVAELLYVVMYDGENRFAAIANAFQNNRPRQISVVEYEPGPEVPSAKRVRRYTVRFDGQGLVSAYLIGGREQELVRPPLVTARGAADKLPCQAKRFHVELANAAADTSLSAAQKAAAIVALADIEPESDEEPADENFSYTALHESVVDTLTGLKTKEALDALATLRDRPEIGARASEALARSGDERFLPALPMGWEKADGKARLRMAWELFRKNKQATPVFCRMVQLLAPEFQTIETTSKLNTCKIAKITFNRHGGGLDGLRFTTPAGNGIHLAWLFASPKDLKDFNEYILPVQGTMEGFNHLFETKQKFADVPWPDDYRVNVQSLEGRKLQPNTEYIIWFALPDDRPVDFYVAMNLFPNVTGGYGSVDKSLGLKPVPKPQ